MQILGIIGELFFIISLLPGILVGFIKNKNPRENYMQGTS
jgi:hypothetical protein